jgi:hypothetical protein
MDAAAELEILKGAYADAMTEIERLLHHNAMLEDALRAQVKELFPDMRTEIERLRAEHAWRPISEAPPEPLSAELYFGNLTFKDQDGRDMTDVLPVYRVDACRRERAYWDGVAWFYADTGHRIFEFGDEPSERLPTHWMRLQASPGGTSHHGCSRVAPVTNRAG